MIYENGTFTSNPLPEDEARKYAGLMDWVPTDPVEVEFITTGQNLILAEALGLNPSPEFSWKDWD